MYLIAYGSSGHSHRQPGLVIEAYTRRLQLRQAGVHRIVRSIIDPSRTERIGKVAHYFVYRGQGERAVTENFEPQHGHHSETVSVELLRVNHYFTRFAGGAQREAARDRASSTGKLVENMDNVAERDLRLNEVEDDVLVPYGRAVRAALAARAAGSPLPVGSFEARPGRRSLGRLRARRSESPPVS